MSDVEIAQSATMKPIMDLALEKLGIQAKELVPYGHYKAKISLDYLHGLEEKKSKLILVTAMSPTPAGEGKTTTVVGLGDALNRLNKKAIICLREPSLGPCFGLKGGAAGGGYAQVVPMEDINLHFTGDFHAISIAHNLLAAMIDNHLHHGNALQIDINAITWKRVVDMNDRALREIAIGQGSKVNGVERTSGFDIVAASEVMAILCLATSLDDLKARLARIIIGYTQAGTPVYAEDLKASGAMSAILKDAINPNLVQTLENNLAIIHGGPFANIAHGCNSVIATKAALKLADYAIVEAGFGADLGAEKFLDIKCRSADLTPSAVVLVVTIRAIKYHGDVALENLNTENLTAVEKGFANVAKHIENIKQKFALNMLVCINHFKDDTEAELSLVSEMCSKLDVKSVISKHWLKGGEGAEYLALEVLDLVKEPLKKDFLLYKNEDLIEEKIKTIANEIYGASRITYSDKAIEKLKTLQLSASQLPICIAKTPASFSTDPNLKGAPINHCLEVSDLILNNGAGFIIVKAGNIMTMPGLPKNPIAEKIDINAKNLITGLM